jgi:hypothetical protein
MAVLLTDTRVRDDLGCVQLDRHAWFSSSVF